MGLFDGLKKLVGGADAEAGPMGWDNTTQKQWSGAPADESDSGGTFDNSNAMKWDNVKNAPATDDVADEDASTLVIQESEASGELVKLGSEASFESDSAAEAEGLDELGDV